MLNILGIKNANIVRKVARIYEKVLKNQNRIVINIAFIEEE